MALLSRDAIALGFEQCIQSPGDAGQLARIVTAQSLYPTRFDRRDFLLEPPDGRERASHHPRHGREQHQHQSTEPAGHLLPEVRQLSPLRLGGIGGRKHQVLGSARSVVPLQAPAERRHARAVPGHEIAEIRAAHRQSGAQRKIGAGERGRAPYQPAILFAHRRIQSRARQLHAHLGIEHDDLETALSVQVHRGNQSDHLFGQQLAQRGVLQLPENTVENRDREREEQHQRHCHREQQAPADRRWRALHQRAGAGTDAAAPLRGSPKR